MAIFDTITGIIKNKLIGVIMKKLLLLALLLSTQTALIAAGSDSDDEKMAQGHGHDEAIHYE